MAVHAIVRGKLRAASNNWERLEDLFTSTIFQQMNYLNSEILLIPFLHSFLNSKGNSIVLTGSIFLYEMVLWPRFGRVEPDILIKLDIDKNHRMNILIEAKLFSGKSGSAIYDELGNYSKASDQLEKEYTVLQNEFPNDTNHLLFLTRDTSFPETTIEESEIAIGQRSIIYWSNYGKLFNLTENAMLTASYSEMKVLNDLRSILEYYGFSSFSGWTIDKVTLKSEKAEKNNMDIFEQLRNTSHFLTSCKNHLEETQGIKFIKQDIFSKLKNECINSPEDWIPSFFSLTFYDECTERNYLNLTMYLNFDNEFLTQSFAVLGYFIQTWNNSEIKSCMASIQDEIISHKNSSMVQFELNQLHKVASKANFVVVPFLDITDSISFINTSLEKIRMVNQSNI